MKVNGEGTDTFTVLKLNREVQRKMNSFYTVDTTIYRCIFRFKACSPVGTLCGECALSFFAKVGDVARRAPSIARRTSLLWSSTPSLAWSEAGFATVVAAILVASPRLGVVSRGCLFGGGPTTR